MEYNEALLSKYLQTHSQEDREAVIVEYSKLAKLIAGQLYAKNSMYMLEKGDYEGFAVIGLIDAISKYNESVGVKFETYASHRIHGAILDELRKFDTIKRTVRDNQKLYKSYQEITFRMYGPGFTRNQLMEANNLTDEQLIKIERDVILEEAVSFEGLIEITDDDGPTFDPKDETHLGDGEKEVLQKDLAECLQKALSVLTEKERNVITFMYYEDLTQAEIAEILGVTESRVSQLHTKALMKMRNAKELDGWSIKRKEEEVK